MRSRLVPLVLSYLREAGADAEALADEVGVPAVLRDPEEWSMDAPAMPVDAVARLCDGAAGILDEPLLGLMVAESLPRGTYGVLEFAARNAPTVRAAVDRLVRHQRLINDAVEYSLAPAADGVALSHVLPGSPEGVGVQGNLFTLAILHRYLKELAPGRSPIRVEVAHATPTAALGEFFDGADVRFGAARNALVHAAEVFDLPVAGADPSLLPVLDEYAQRLMPPEDPASGWRARVRDHLRRTLSGGAPSLDETAEHLSTSPRNLQRQLAALDTTFSAVLDELRAEEARRLLRDESLAVGEIAFVLGYSEARAFVRAFKRWTGESPGRFRR